MIHTGQPADNRPWPPGLKLHRGGQGIGNCDEFDATDYAIEDSEYGDTIPEYIYSTSDFDSIEWVSDECGEVCGRGRPRV